ncbi:hypothetical protein EXIGLDRAFT_749596 [Exidia glandulosa HHB12029]|uniref:PB1 domain-containing protein n=1 Tax=Exidia glandulosa HHB12029 TaxID=1314781 RepID=A0A165HW70_EXIGL|nr:hypothetical protein EXIGLDRAFT_749596 [Exidia glandulosa HHB12029]
MDRRRTDQNPDKFRDLLMGAAQGLALFHPSLDVEYGGAVGDCGYMESGRFWKLFNIFDPPPGMPGLPPPQRGSRRTEALPNNGVLTSSNTSSFSLRGGLPFSSPPFEIDASLNVSRNEASVAFLAYGGQSHEVDVWRDTKVMKDYLLANEDLIVRTYDMTPVATCGLLLLFGTTRVNAWCGGVAHALGTSVQAKIKVTLAGIDVVELAATNEVTQQGATTQADWAITRGPLDPAYDSTSHKYCVIVRPVVVRKRERLWRRATTLLEVRSSSGSLQQIPPSQNAGNQITTPAASSSTGSCGVGQPSPSSSSPQESDAGSSSTLSDDKYEDISLNLLAEILDRILADDNSISAAVADWGIVSTYALAYKRQPDPSCKKIYDTRVGNDNTWIADVTGLLPADNFSNDILHQHGEAAFIPIGLPTSLPTMDDGLRYSFNVWFRDEQTTILWTSDMNAGRNTGPPTWARVLEDAIVDVFSLPRGSRLTLTYADREGTQSVLTRDAPYNKFWESLPRTARHASTGKHGRLDVRRVEVERAKPAMCEIALGSRTRHFWCSLDDSSWDDIQLVVAQAFGLPSGSSVAFSVYDDEEDEITICDPFSWRILLSLLAIAPQSSKPVPIQITSVNGTAALPVDNASTNGGSTGSAIGVPRTLIPLPYLGASKVRFFVGATTRASFWFRNAHTDPDAFLVNFRVLWARAAVVLGRSATQGAFPEMFTFDHKGRLVTLTTALCWKTYASILSTYDKPFNKIEMHIKPPGTDAISPPTSTPAASQKGSRFQIRAGGSSAPVLVFVYRQALHIAEWSKKEGETDVQEWARAQAHLRELFKVPALTPYTLSYVDAEHKQQIVSSPESWQAFVAFARVDVNKIRIMSLAQQGETPAATTRPPAPIALTHAQQSSTHSQILSPPPTPQTPTPGQIAAQKTTPSSVIASWSEFTCPPDFEPPPPYSSILTQKAPLVSPPGSVLRSQPPMRAIPLPTRPSRPLPPLPSQSHPSLPAPISPPPPSLPMIAPLSPLPPIPSSRAPSPLPPPPSPTPSRISHMPQSSTTSESTLAVGSNDGVSKVAARAPTRWCA